MSEHCGYVVQVKDIRKHTNADRLQIATFFGNDTVVGLETKAGDIGVYFPTDLQLSERFCQVNDLIRRKDENGNPCGGYLDPDKRNVKAVKLRGEKSDGLYLPITCLTDFCTISDLKVGDQISMLNGEEICRKYVPRRNPNYGVGGSRCPKRAKKNIAPTFFEHVETEQLAYNLNKFRNGDIVQLTLKMHGCFVYGTRVRMADGTQKQIQHIKPGDKVLGYNFVSNRFEPATVLNTFKNEKSNHWRRIKISRDHILGAKGPVVCTPNHPFWVDERQEYVLAKDLVPGTTIMSAFPSLILTDEQKQIIAGNLLGDGYIRHYEHKVADIETSSIKHEYIEYLTKVSGGLYYTNNRIYTSGYGSKVYRGRATRSADIYNYFDKYITWDNNRFENRLKESFPECVSPLSLAVFYMDDGSLQHSDKQRDRATFSICDYNEHDAKIICNCFRKYNIEPSLFFTKDNYAVIRLNTDEAYKFFELIKKYIPSCMAYKLPSDILYDQANVLDSFSFESPVQGYVFSPQTVIENRYEYSSRGRIEYDLETSLHNYIVGYSLVHNTSGRTGYLPLVTENKQKWWQKLLHRPACEHFEYGYITGTRRVVLANENKGGFYESDDFRHAMAKKFEGRLHEGETVYYEIVGFQGPNGAPIMASVANSKVKDKEFSKMYGDTTVFAYGCDPAGTYEIQTNEAGDMVMPPCCEVYVYRMTMVNGDGDVVEYSPAQIKYRCEQMGVNTVKEFETFIIPDDVDPGEYVVRKVEQYYDGPDPIGYTHIREGVVARILNRNNFSVYKHKNFSFKCLEGIIKDEAQAPDMEEAQEVMEVGA